MSFFFAFTVSSGTVASIGRGTMVVLTLFLAVACSGTGQSVSPVIPPQPQAQSISRPGSSKQKRGHRRSEFEKKMLALEARLERSEKELVAMPRPPECGNDLVDARREIESIDAKIKSGRDPATITALQADRDRITKFLDQVREVAEPYLLKLNERQAIIAEIDALEAGRKARTESRVVSTAKKRARLEELNSEIENARQEAITLGIDARASPNDGPDTTSERIEALLRTETDPARVADLKEQKARLLKCNAATQKVLEKLKRLEAQKASLDAELNRD
jgi:hypothetical protein